MRNTARRFSLLPLAFLALAPVAGFGEQTDDETAGVLEKALEFSPEYTTPVVDAESIPVAVFADLNSDGDTDVALLTIAVQSGIEPRAEQLSEPGRLYSEGALEPLFILETYFAGQDAIVTVQLGRRILWTDLSLLPLTPDPFPVAITIGFRERTRETTELVIFQRDGMVSRFSLENNRSRQGAVVDINGDARLDIVTAARVPEAGRGFETFLELHELGPEGFRRSASLPIVRGVNEFLAEAAREMEDEAWEAVRKRVGFGGGNEPAEGVVELETVFVAAAEEDEPDAGAFDYPETGTDIEDVTFPRLSDNPFPASYVGRSFRLVFRVECCDETPRFFETTVGLSENPFAGRPIAFLTESEAGK